MHVVAARRAHGISSTPRFVTKITTHVALGHVVTQHRLELAVEQSVQLFANEITRRGHGFTHSSPKDSRNRSSARETRLRAAGSSMPHATAISRNERSLS